MIFLWWFAFIGVIIGQINYESRRKGGDAVKLKKYPISQLQEGMVVGRGIYEEDLTVILAEGTVLDRQMIASLMSRDIYFVHVREGVTAAGKIAHEAAGADAAPQADVSGERGMNPILPSLNIVTEAVSPEKDAALAEFMQEVADTVATPPVIFQKKAPPVVKTAAAPQKDASLEDAYVRQYNDLYLNLTMFYEMTRTSGHVDAQAAVALARQILPLCSSAKAITHIYHIEAKGSYAIHHSVRVAILAGLMGQWLKMPQRDQQRLVIAAFLLEIGSTRIATGFLKKAGFYTKEDRVLMQKHTRLGYALVAKSPFGADAQIMGAVLQHHERNDGSGYPDGLKKEQICDFARILAILDSYDAMASKRAYAKQRSPFDVFEILSDDFAADRLDAGYGLLFIRNVCSSLNGSWVRLTNGETGKIVYIDESRIDGLPIVQTMDGAFVDLNTLRTIRVDAILTSPDMAH